MHHRQRGSQTGVLHADFYAERHAFGALQTQQKTNPIAKTKSAEVMKHHHEHNKQACGQKPVGVVRHYNADSKSDHEGRERRQVRRDALCYLWNEALAQQSAGDGQSDRTNA